MIFFKWKEKEKNCESQQQHVSGEANMLISKTTLNNVIHVVGERLGALASPIQFVMAFLFSVYLHMQRCALALKKCELSSTMSERSAACMCECNACASHKSTQCFIRINGASDRTIVVWQTNAHSMGNGNATVFYISFSPKHRSTGPIWPVLLLNIECEMSGNKDKNKAKKKEIQNRTIVKIASLWPYWIGYVWCIRARTNVGWPMRTQLSNGSNIVQAVQPQQLENDTTKYLLTLQIKFRE